MTTSDSSTLTRTPTAPDADVRTARRRAVGAAAVASISGLMFGWDAMSLNVVKKALAYHTGAGNGAMGFAVSFGVLSAVLGAFLAGRLSDRIGRRVIMQISAVLFLVASLGTVFIGSSMSAFLFWRLWSGLAMGASMTIAPAYVSEIAPADLRGRLVSLRQAFLIVGLFVCGLIGDGMLAAAPKPTGKAPQSTGVLTFVGVHLEVWQWAFVSVAAGGVLYLVSALFIPESPRYLMVRGRVDEARAVLARTLGATHAQERVDAIAASLHDVRKPRFADVLNGRRTNLQTIVWIGIGLAALQQLVGINAIFYYATTIWATVGFGEQQALQQTLIITGVKVAAILVGIALVDRLGRKPLLLAGSVLMTVALILVATLMLTAPKAANGNPDLTHSKGLALMALVAMCAYVFAYAGTWGPLMWVLVGEMFPNRMRGAATSVAGGAEWMANYAVTLTFPVLAAWSIGTTYGIYAFFALASIVFVIRLVPETKGRELEDMDVLAGRLETAA